MPTTESQLIKRAQRGDANAIGEIYELYRPEVFGYLLSHLGQPEVAEGMTADVFIRLVDTLDTYQDNGTPIAAWLQAIAQGLLNAGARRGAYAQEAAPAPAYAGGQEGEAIVAALDDVAAAGKVKLLSAYADHRYALRSRREAEHRAAASARRPAREVGRTGTTNRQRLLGLGLGLALALLTMLSGRAAGAASVSLPGDPYYSLKRTAESARLTLTFGAQARQRLQTELNAGHEAEIQAMVDMGRQATAGFEDTLQAVGSDGMWTVGPFQVQVTGETVLGDTPAVGDRLQVQVQVQPDGSLAALRVQQATE